MLKGEGQVKGEDCIQNQRGRFSKYSKQMCTCTIQKYADSEIMEYIYIYIFPFTEVDGNINHPISIYRNEWKWGKKNGSW